MTFDHDPTFACFLSKGSSETLQVLVGGKSTVTVSDLQVHS